MTYKDLNTKEKIEHIWEYYRHTIIIGTILIISFISIFYNIFIKPHPNLFCGLAVYNYHLPISQIDEITNELNNKFNLDPTKSTIEIQSFYTDDSDPLTEVNLNQKFDTYIYSSQFNLIFTDLDNTNSFINSGYVSRLDEYLTKEEISSLESQNKILYAIDPYSNEKTPMAVNIKGSKLLNEYNIYKDKDCYLSFVPMPNEYTENTLKVFREFLK